MRDTGKILGIDMVEIGIIGTGDMGKLYAREFSQRGYTVNVCDLPEKREELEHALEGTQVNIFDDGIAVSRRSDIIFYLVEVENLERVVAQYGHSTKKNAIVSSGASVMTPAIAAFEKYLPDDVAIINWHWLFGPSVKPTGQSTAVVRHRSSKETYQRAMNAFEAIETKIIELPSYQDHDKITADTQVATHVGFESMGTGWKNMGSFPWENPTYVGGIDNVKILMCLRIYGGKSHVYSGLAIHNPFAQEQVMQYARSVSELFSLMIKEDAMQFTQRVMEAGNAIFNYSAGDGRPIMLDDAAMGEFSLGAQGISAPNSHLSLLAMVDAWHQSGINPYDNMICQTPVFRLRLGIAEYLFRNKELLEESIRTALFDKSIRGDDLEFHTAVREWATIIGHGDGNGYRQQFDSTRDFFRERLSQGMRKSDELIKKLAEKTA